MQPLLVIACQSIIETVQNCLLEDSTDNASLTVGHGKTRYV